MQESPRHSSSSGKDAATAISIAHVPATSPRPASTSISSPFFPTTSLPTPSAPHTSQPHASRKALHRQLSISESLINRLAQHHSAAGIPQALSDELRTTTNPPPLADLPCPPASLGTLLSIPAGMPCGWAGRGGFFSSGSPAAPFLPARSPAPDIEAAPREKSKPKLIH